MRFIGVSREGKRIFRASSVHAATDFHKLFGGSMEYGILLHKWYVLL